MFNASVLMIQSVWRSYRCRQKVCIFRQLPNDLWWHILCFVRMVDPILLHIDKIIMTRAQLLYFTHPNYRIKEKLQTLRLARKYNKYLSEKSYFQCLALSLRLLNYTRDYSTQLLINATLETLSNLQRI